MLKILLVEKHPIVSSGLEIAIEAEDDIEVVGTSNSVEEAWRLTEKLKPDLVVTNLVLKAGDCGVELCEKIKTLPEPPAVLWYTDRNSTEDLVACRSSSADGYVHKGECRAKLIEAIRSLCAGRERWFIGDSLEHLEQPGIQEVSDYNGLTPREREVLELLEKRWTNTEIAHELCISCETARFHAKNVLSKLGLRSRRQIATESYFCRKP